ncbi:VWA domain-containing protein [Rhizobium sp. KVB221]|uniref:VWA domain-containing protein n=1 Tax=Rhizobium setariae TaxID=2801340 RepID=A0A936YRQ1_9HYPH|nr:TadE/TadG family type IV pilus assembly protein [Rhizobium setariae]MBL0374433.1 VWA domain-containing protein [Rhizobium setariae]
MSSLGRRLKALANDRSGNFALTFALVSVPLLVAVGCSFDYVRAMNTHRKMQSDLDAALVAAVNKVGVKDEKALKTEINTWLEAEAETKGIYVLNTDAVAIDATNATIKASVRATVPTTLLKIVGINTVPVAVEAAVLGGKTTTTVTHSAFSMYLVLDRSGSMDEDTNTTYTTTCYKKESTKSGPYTCTKKYTKMEALKLAVGSLTTQLTNADPEVKYVRLGAVSYNDKMQPPTPLAWGTSGTTTYVNALTPKDRTNSGGAFKMAYDSLVAPSENTAHMNKNGNNAPSKYIIFMTDGENNENGADTLTKEYCDKARNANPQVRVYTIAFMAPTAGQNLLRYCATNPEDYFPAESTGQLVNAFQVIGQTSAKTLLRLTQ